MTRDGDTDVGRGSRAKSVAWMFETHEGQCRLDNKNELVTRREVGLEVAMLKYLFVDLVAFGFGAEREEVRCMRYFKNRRRELRNQKDPDDEPTLSNYLLFITLELLLRCVMWIDDGR